MRTLNILYIAYPLLPVTAESCGGAEQVLATMERELAQRGHRTTLAACAGSQAAGEVFVTGATVSEADQFERRAGEHHKAILDFVAVKKKRGEPFDIIHDHSGGFWREAHKISIPVLATLHQPRDFYPHDFYPRDFYPKDAFSNIPPNLFFNFVSKAQQQTFEGSCVSGYIVPNGIDLERFRFESKKENYLLWLGRFCEEKGAHVALEVARAAGLPIVIAGQVYPFTYHQQYFEREIAPRIARNRKNVKVVITPSLPGKIDLLQHARAVLISSSVAETSSLVAMEAAACGTPVLALRRGALPEVVADNTSGLLVDSQVEMIEALSEVGSIRPQDCRCHAEDNFSHIQMDDGYEQLYKEIIARSKKQEQMVA